MEKMEIRFHLSMYNKYNNTTLCFINVILQDQQSF